MIDHLSDLGDIIIIIKVLVTLHVTQPSAVLSMKRHKNHLKSALGLRVPGRLCKKPIRPTERENQ